MSSSNAEPVRFEQAIAELESILHHLEDGTTSLEDALARYERGVGLLRQCYGQLKEVEQRVKLLSATTDDGAPNLVPFEHVASIDIARASVRRSGKDANGQGIPG